jgi:phage portal protein BeeE
MKNPFYALLSLKAAPKREVSDQPRTPMQFWRSPGLPIVSYEEAVSAEAALRHPVIFRIVNKIAVSVQSVRWYVEEDRSLTVKEQAGPATLKALTAVLNAPNDDMTADQLRYWLALNYALYARAPLKIGVGSQGTVNGIYPLETKHVRAVVNERGSIDHYLYGHGQENSQKFKTRRRAERENTVSSGYACEIVTPNLAGSFDTGSSVSPLASVALAAQVIRLLLQRAVDTASGHPNTKYVIGAEKTLTNAQKSALTKEVTGSETGGENSGGVLFVYNTKLDVHKLDNDLKDIHSKIPVDDMSRLIAGAFGVPVALLGLGAADAAKFAGNYSEARQSFWEDTIIPAYLSPIASGLTAAVCPPGAVVRFDYDTIPALSDVRIARGEGLTKVDFLTEDEKRELVDYGPAAKSKAVAVVSGETPLKLVQQAG